MQLIDSPCLMLFCMLGLAPNLAQGEDALAAADLRCEYRRDPLGLETARPRLSWVLQSTRRGQAQTAYQILVADSLERLGRDEGNLWDSGKVDSPETLEIAYQGRPLASRQACYWKVRVWDKEGHVSPWSQPATWELGLLAPEDWQAQWLSDGRPNPEKDEDLYREDPAPLFRREFALTKPVRRARLYITGLGYYEANLNGRRVGDHVLDPGWTRYDERVLYSTYDVTEHLRQGANCLGVMLGNGWYNPLPLRMWGHLNLHKTLPVGRPKLLAQLEVEFVDGTRQTIHSAPDWKVGEGPVRFNNIYLGEVYDARQEAPGWDQPGFDDSAWQKPAVAEAPAGRLQAQSQPPIRVTATLPTVNVTEPRPGVFIYDLGKNFAGWVRLNLTAPAGTKITLRYGELLHKDGALNPLTSVCGQIKGMQKNENGTEELIGGPGSPTVAWQSDTYIAKGQGPESWTPRFTFHGFRYVEVTGYPGGQPPRDLVTGLRLNSDVERVGSFDCSNDRFNRIQAMCDQTFLSNIFSVQSDCPHRERFGYGGDLSVTSEAFMMNYDMATFYAKVVRDWADSALEDGMLTDTAPFVGIQYCGVSFAMVHPLIQRQLEQYYGNRRLIDEQYGVSKRWLDLVAAQTPGHIVKEGLGDHETLEAGPTEEMVTPMYAAGARLVGTLARLIGRTKDAEHDEQLAAAIRQAYLERFFDPATGKFGPGTQASQAYALYWDLVPAEQRTAVLKVLLDDINDRHAGHLSTGIFGTKFMLDALSREGQSETVYRMVDQPTCPGWGYMLENGATTLWEHWVGSDDVYSNNHPMFGSVSEWFYHWLGGIQPDPEARGFDRIIIRPQTVRGLEWVQCSYRSMRGTIVSNWRREGERLKLEVEIPVGVTALVYVPATSADEVREGDLHATEAEGVTILRAERGALVYRVGSGRYCFTVTPAPVKAGA